MTYIALSLTGKTTIINQFVLFGKEATNVFDFLGYHICPSYLPWQKNKIPFFVLWNFGLLINGLMYDKVVISAPTPRNLIC